MSVRDISALCSQETTPIFDSLLQERPEWHKLFDDSIIEELRKLDGKSESS